MVTAEGSAKERAIPFFLKSTTNNFCDKGTFMHNLTPQLALAIIVAAGIAAWIYQEFTDG